MKRLQLPEGADVSSVPGLPYMVFQIDQPRIILLSLYLTGMRDLVKLEKARPRPAIEERHTSRLRWLRPLTTGGCPKPVDATWSRIGLLLLD